MAAGLRLLSALLLAGSALAHVRMTAISVNGGSFVTDSVRLPWVFLIRLTNIMLIYVSHVDVCRQIDRVIF